MRREREKKINIYTYVCVPQATIKQCVREILNTRHDDK
jgi:hypothetical protein